MGMLLLIIGCGWAILGAANIYMYTGPITGMTVCVVFNAVAFILPGLLVGGLGSLLRKKNHGNTL